VTIVPNSVDGREIAYQMHPNVNLRAYEKTGGLVIERGDGTYVTDNNGKRYIEAVAGLWAAGTRFWGKAVGCGRQCANGKAALLPHLRF
jgi:4-aminobutyrate---pyruvate transaminase